MLKAVGRLSDGRPLVVLGLSHENLSRLREGRPIEFDLAELSLQGRVLIFAGETEAAMAEELQKLGAPVQSGAPPEQDIEP